MHSCSDFKNKIQYDLTLIKQAKVNTTIVETTIRKLRTYSLTPVTMNVLRYGKRKNLLIKTIQEQDTTGCRRL